MEGTYFTAGLYADSADARVRNFIAEYRRQTGDFPNYLAAQAYDAAGIVFGTLYPPAASGAEVKARLDAVAGFVGISGVTTLRAADGMLDKKITILTVREGEVVPAPE